VSRAKALVVLVPAALALIAGAAVASSTSVTITTPTEGQSISKKRVPQLPVTGGVAFAAATPSTSLFYVRRDGCGTSNDNPHLSISTGTDAGSGCGSLINGVVGAGGDVDAGAFVDYPSTDGMPLALDSSRNVTGTFDIQGFIGPAQAGLMEADVSMEALVGGEGVPIGSVTEMVVLDPTASDNLITFTITPSAALDQTDLSGIDLRLHLHGPYAFSGFVATNGASFVNVPSYTASTHRSVLLSLDDPAFASPVPVAINTAGDGWSVVIPTPAVGKHTLYAQSVQGFDSSAVVARHFTVSK
jgi:hypothetical protein